MTPRTYIAPTERRAMTRSRRVKIFLRANGICHICGTQIRDGEAWDVSHDDALVLGGADDDSNAKPAHYRCHKIRTAQDAKATAKRNKAIDHGYVGKAKRSGFQSRFRKKISGAVVDRQTGELVSGRRG